MSCTANKLPLPYDLVFYRGDTFERVFRLGVVNTEPKEYYDLTGCTVVCQVREYIDGPIVATPVVEVDPDQVTNKGCINFSLDTNFVKYSGEVGVWDLQVTWPDDSKVTYLKGKVIAELDVSYV